MLNEVAISLRNAYQNGSIEPLSNIHKFEGAETAYKIQQINTDFWIKEGRRLVGRKIGLTSASIQKQLGVNQPDFGALFADMAYGSGEEIDIKRLLQPKAEAEIAFVLKKDLPHQKHTYADIIDATAYILPCIEIVDSRIKNWNIQFVDTVADNASSAAYVLGSSPIKLNKVDLEMCGMKMECKGEVVSTGMGMACLGNPMNAVIWLANKMVETGSPLQAGDLILSGALGSMVNVQAGDSFKASISGLGSVHIHFSN